jgi:hypothetical protein
MTQTGIQGIHLLDDDGDGSVNIDLSTVLPLDMAASWRDFYCILL